MIIGLGYKARSGKDTVADYLVKKYSFKKRSFASALKDGAKAIFNLSEEQLYGDKKEEIDPYWKLTPRYILQLMGTECMRDGFDKNIWIKALHGHILQNGGEEQDWVIPDVRFLNEVQAVKQWGGYIFKIDRRKDQNGISGHPSENELNSFTDWDTIIDNDKDHDHLYRKIDELLTLLKFHKRLG